MVEPADPTISLRGPLDKFLLGKHSFVVYTHGGRTRSIIAALFLSYLIFFAMFINSIADQLRKLQDIPPILAGLDAAEGHPWMSYIAAGLSLLVALGFLLYFMWAVLDIWGLQVCLSPVEVRIQNTITGNALPQFMGIGRLRMEDIETLRGARFFTYVSGKSGTIRFSPVESVDRLIAGILSYAPEANVVE